MENQHILPMLPYSYDALEPYIDARTMEIHHSKHHQGYVDKLNAAIERYPELREKGIEQILFDLSSIPEDIRTAVRNNGGGHFSHSLYWTVMTPHDEEKKMSGELSADPEAIHIQKELEAALGTKVQVERSGQTGKITITFFSPEELHGIVQKLTSTSTETGSPLPESPITI